MLALDGPGESVGRVQMNHNERRRGGGDWSGHDQIRLGGGEEDMSAQEASVSELAENNTFIRKILCSSL
jgi:hypothetical protein